MVASNAAMTVLAPTRSSTQGRNGPSPLWTGCLSTKTQAGRWLGEHAPIVRQVLGSTARVRGESTDADSEDRLLAGLEALRQAAATDVEEPPPPP